MNETPCRPNQCSWLPCTLPGREPLPGPRSARISSLVASAPFAFRNSEAARHWDQIHSLYSVVVPPDVSRMTALSNPAQLQLQNLIRFRFSSQKNQKNCQNLPNTLLFLLRLSDLLEFPLMVFLPSPFISRPTMSDSKCLSHSTSRTGAWQFVDLLGSRIPQ